MTHVKERIRSDFEHKLKVTGLVYSGSAVKVRITITAKTAG
jgi:hypothetical protein